jgi:hypothetical protein
MEEGTYIAGVGSVSFPFFLLMWGMRGGACKKKIVGRRMIDEGGNR